MHTLFCRTTLPTSYQSELLEPLAFVMVSLSSHFLVFRVPSACAAGPLNPKRATCTPLLQNEKAEFSLSKALKEHMIGLYINLPSRNKFRRPASFMSRGYLTRRMAVDHQVWGFFSFFFLLYIFFVCMQDPSVSPFNWN